MGCQPGKHGKKPSSQAGSSLWKQTSLDSKQSAGSNFSFRSINRVPGGPTKHFTDGENPKDKLVGVIVTIYDGSSYDEMFREIRPITVPGERVSTYSMGGADIGALHGLLAAAAPPPPGSAWTPVVEDVRGVPADSVVFNWECCSGCGNHAFPCLRAQRGASNTMSFMGYALGAGFTVMCSDFSLKSLLHEWSVAHLGPNPFLQMGSCDMQICLEFDSAALQHEEVPQQLQVVGELCAEQGKAVVSAMSDTIVYTLNPTREQTALYELKVLTVATEYGGPSLQEDMKCSIGHKRGSVGHATLTYASGGQLVTSMGHWIELTRIDTSVEAVMEAARHNFGQAEWAEYQREYALQCSDMERNRWVQEKAHDMCKKSVPSRMKQRTKFG